MPRPDKISGLTPAMLAEALTKGSGSPISAAMIQADIQAGAPANPDGTISLVSYVAWLIKQGTDGSRA